MHPHTYSSANWLLSTLVALLCLLPRFAAGDTLFLVNGDRLTGTVTRAADGLLVFTTEYAGELHVDIARVRLIETDAPIAVRLTDGTTEAGRFVIENDSQLLATDEARRPLAIADVEVVAPDLEALAPVAPPEEEARKWSGSADAGVSYRSGETDTMDAHLGLTFKREWPKNVLTLELGAGYSEADSEVNARTLEGRAKWQYYLKDRLYLFSELGAEHDPGRRLELRFEAIEGLGYDVIRTDRRKLSLDAGLGYTREYWNEYSIKELEAAKRRARKARDTAFGSFNSYLQALIGKPVTFGVLANQIQRFNDSLPEDVSQETEMEDFMNLRLAAHFEQKLLKESLLSEELALLAALSDPGGYRASSDLAFSTPLSEKLSLRLNLKTEYVSETSQGDDQFDNIFTMGLRYSF